MKIIIFGGDGFCGWPTSLHLSNLGYDVMIVDNLSRRNIDNELQVGSLTPIQSIDNRLIAWEELTGKAKPFQISVCEDTSVVHQLGLRVSVAVTLSFSLTGQRACHGGAE